MAHLILLTRGIAQCRDIWKKYMETQMYVWKRKNLTTGKWEKSGVQGALRPIELWEYVVPSDCIPQVMVNLGLQNYIARPEIKKFAWLMKKGMKLSELPDCKDLQPDRYMFKDGMAFYPIGVKEDVFQDYPNFKTAEAPDGYYQEGL